MKQIDLSVWNRREIYKIFRAMQFPHFSVSSELDVTALLAFAGEHNLSSYGLVLYLVCRAANEVPAFRLRLHGETVVEHETLSIAPTTAWKEGLFNFVVAPYHKDPAQFLKIYSELDARVKAMDHLNLEDDANTGDACVYTSCVPWFHITGGTNPLHSADDAIPRVVWGKYIKREGRTIMGVALQCHHAVADGRDVAVFLEKMQTLADAAPQTFASLLNS